MNKPKLRFKADDGSAFPDWEEHKIKEFVNESNIIGHTGKDAKKLTVKLWAKGVVPKENIFAGSEKTQYYIRHAGQLMYGKLDFLNCAFGIVPPELDGYESTLDSPAFDVHDISDKFLLSYITRKSFYKKNGDIANGSRKAKRIHPDVFGEMDIHVPSLPEQQKIAKFLSTIDTVIAKQKETVSAWEERKKGVMQKLFNQEVRFKADDGSDYPDWEEKKLKNILKEYKEYSAKDGSYEHVSLTKEGVVPKSERYERDFLVKDVDKKYRITHLGDICYNPANLKFGVICRNKYGDGIFSPIYVTFRVCKDMLPEFVEMLVTRRDFIEYALKYQQGTVYERMSVSPDDLLSIKVMVPCMAEQKKIADCLVSLDNVINSYKATLSAWEELKKGLLQQMFV